MTYILVDAANTFFRARHVVRGELHEKVGMSLHVVFSSVRKAWKDFDGKHVIFCLDGRSWRKDVYEPYKRNREVDIANVSARDVKEDQEFWKAFDSFKNFIQEKTNCSILYNPRLEADDLIAGWIAQHPNDDHVIISTDGDFAQLIAPNVKQYNGVNSITTTNTGYYDERGKRVKDNKTGELKPAPDPEWLLFEKCMRGDTSDNVFSAYPGVRTKGSKNKVGLIEAYQDRHTKGWAWNNLMLQRWMDHVNVEHRVLEDYQRNITLCDLNAQPDDIKQLIKETIDEEINKKKDVTQVGIRLMKFCVEYDLDKISEQAPSYAEPLNARYHS